jgi:hypothetical protein
MILRLSRGIWINLALCIAMLLIPLALVHAAQVTVTPSALAGWTIAPFGTAPSYGFVNGPDTPPLGSGSFSAQIAVANSAVMLTPPNSTVSGANPNTLGINYSVYLAPSSTVTIGLYVNVYVDRMSNGFGTFSNGSYDCRFDFAFSYGLDAWTSSSISSATPAVNIEGSSCPGIITLGNAGLAGDRIINVAFNIGDTSSSFVGSNAALDNITIFSNLGSNTYDLEPNTPPAASIQAPPPATLCHLVNFEEPGVIRTSFENDADQADLYCRLIAANRAYMTWYGSPLTHSANIGNGTVLDLGVIAAVDVFGPHGFVAGVAVCLQGNGHMIYMDAANSPRIPQLWSTWTTPSFSGYTCTTLYAPGTVVLVEQLP